MISLSPRPLITRLIAMLLFVAINIGYNIANAAAYNQPTAENVIKAYIKFANLNLDPDRTIDEIAQIAYCNLFSKYYSDDFEWNKIHNSIREYMKTQKSKFSTQFTIPGWVYVDHYDFDKKGFKFQEKKGVDHIGIFEIMEGVNPLCSKPDIQTLPTIVRAVLPSPVTIDEIPLSESFAKSLEASWPVTGNDDKAIPIRFNITINGIVSLDENRDNAPTARLSAVLDSVEFYADSTLRQRLYTYAPPTVDVPAATKPILPQDLLNLRTVH